MKPDDYQSTLDHLVWMCDLGQKQYAWWRAKELESTYQDFSGISADLTRIMKGKNENKEMQGLPK